MGRRREGVAVGDGRGVSNLAFASSETTLVSNALTSLLSALLLLNAVILRVSVVIRPDRLSRVIEDCACNCEKPITNRTTTTAPIPKALLLNFMVVPPW